MRYFVKLVFILFCVLYIPALALAIDNASSPCPEITDIHDSSRISHALITIKSNFDVNDLSCVEDEDGIGNQILSNDTSKNTREMLDLIYKRLYKKLIYKAFTPSQEVVAQKVDEYLRDTLDLFVLNEIQQIPNLTVKEGNVISNRLLPRASGSLNASNILTFRNSLINDNVLKSKVFNDQNNIRSEQYKFWSWKTDGSNVLNGDPSISYSALSANYTSVHDYENAKDILLKIYLIKKIFHDKNDNDALEPYRKYIDVLKIEWDHYFDNSKYQYPWELVINSWVYEPTSGLQPPPSSQWVVMHPSIALEYMNNSGTKDSVVVDIVGLNGWGWNKNDNTGNIEYPLLAGISGVACVATYTNHTDLHLDNIGYGGVVYFKSNVSVGIIQHGDNNTGVIVNFDIGKIFLSPSENDKNNNFANVYRNVVFAQNNL